MQRRSVRVKPKADHYVWLGRSWKVKRELTRQQALFILHCATWGLGMVHRMEIKMYYEDTDAGGIIYYANHVKYMERGRTEYLDSLGISLPRLMEQGSLFTVTDLELHYRAYAQYGDVLIVESGLRELAAAFMIIEHRIKKKETGRLVAEGSTKLVCVSAQGKAKRIPRDMRTTLQAELTASKSGTA